MASDNYWYHNAYWHLVTTSEIDDQDIPVFQNRTGHPVKITGAYLAGNIAASATAYYDLTLKDDGGNTIFSKSLINVALTASSSTTMGTVTAAYQVIDNGNTVYLYYSSSDSCFNASGSQYG